jgi:hypothetical protein
VNTVLSEGEVFCVNSELPYLTVVFSFSNLLIVRYSTNTSGHQIHGAFTVPGKIGGIDFSDRIGHLEIESLLGGPLNFTLFAFPEQCSGLRYVTNLDPDVFTFQEKFKANLGRGPICLWNTDRTFVLQAPDQDGIRVCRAANCQPVSGLSANNSFKNLDFFIVNRSDDYFLKQVVVKFKSRKFRPPLKISEILLRETEPSLIELADQLWAEDVPQPVKQVFVQGDDESVRRMRVKPMSDQFILFIVLVVVIVIGIIAMLFSIVCYWIRQKKVDDAHRGETESLIRADDPRRFPVYGYPYGYPMSGVYFPQIPPGEASTNTT